MVAALLARREPEAPAREGVPSAGAAQVAIVSDRRWAVVRELEDEPEPSLDAMIARLDPCDLVIVEGYKAAPIPKIETRRREAAREAPLADTDPNVIAVAADYPCAGAGRPVLALDDVAAIADVVVATLGIRPSAPAKAGGGRG